jgi:glutamate-1-semialdehyde 2,1-aminomutase
MIQARMKSSRLPGKVSMELGRDHTVLGLGITRALRSKLANSVVVLTTTDSADDKIVIEAQKYGVASFRGSERDVLSRYFEAAEAFNADVIIRITSDCPFIDPELIDESISRLLQENAEYYCNQEPFVFPDGMDVDVFTRNVLSRAHLEATSQYDREHVTPYIKGIAKKATQSEQSADFSHIRLTVDEPEDLSVARQIYLLASDPETISCKEILQLLEANPELRDFNSHIKSNEGALMNTGSKIYKRAKRVIPGGNMLLSKRPEMFLQEGWPSYYSRAKGCEIWDLDDNSYLDMSIMGIGTNTLGYAYGPVDEAVKMCVDSSNMSTFNCPEEVYLAEKLIELHPWADSAKFARTGGEINAIAIRIARAASGRNEVAICGYHGWHDWYLSANLSGRSNLNEHLLPGLNPIGVPKELAGLTHALRYNSFEDLEILDRNQNIGVLMMEVMRSVEPEAGYLEAVREKCSKNNIVLIFDECTSGFRETYGGLHLKFGIMPDMATFGKALGNGFAITALIGRESVMSSANDTFISSTFWSERIGYVAALATLEEMKRLESWKRISRTGTQMREIWKRTFESVDLKLEISGIPALSAHSIQGSNGNMIKTIITQEMLKKSILASNIFYPSIAHSESHLERYESNLKEVLLRVSSTKNLEEMMDSKPAQTGFKRLN